MKITLSILAGILLFTNVLAQDAKIEIVPSYGYTFTSRTNWGTLEMNLEDEYSAGLALDVRVHEEMLIELSYNTMQTNFNATVYNGYLGREYYKTPLSVDYFQIGGIREFSNEKVRPYTLFSLGATRFHPTGDVLKTNEITHVQTSSPGSDKWSLSATFGGGAKIMFSERIGLRLQARMLLPLYFSGIGIYCGSSCGGGASFGAYFVQLDLTGGLVIGLGNY
jgi:hypothetical protein